MADPVSRKTGALGPIAAGIAVAGVVVLAARFGRRTSPTDDHPDIRDWYRALDKPAYTPPPVVFGLAWPVIEAGLAASAWRLLRRPSTPARDAALALALGNQAGLVAFNELYFGRRMMGWGTLCAGGLVVTSATCCIVAGQDDPPARTMAAPLPVWLCFATLLAGDTWRRNRT